LTVLTVATHRRTVVREHADITVKITQTQQFHSKHGALFELGAAIQRGNNLE
jgi:hypothetical protein